MDKKLSKVIALCIGICLCCQRLASASGLPPAPAFREGPSLIAAASGYRNYSSGALGGVGSNGYCWSSAPNSAANAYNLNFNSGNVYPLNNNNRAFGFAVRPVRAFNLAAAYVPSLTMDESARHLSRTELHSLMVQAYLDARRNERNKLAQLEFEADIEGNLWSITDEVYRHDYRLSPLICFMIEWPTRREVFAPAFRDRVVSHLLFNMLCPLFERTFIYDTYSCRKGKGTDFGIARFQHFVRSCTDNYREEAYVLQLDVSGFFMSINKGLLYENICSKMEDYRNVFDKASGRRWGELIDYSLADYLVRLTLFRNPTENCRRIGGIGRWEGFPESKSQFHSKLGTGLIIGDLDSQLEQNIYMSPYDHWMKRDMKCRYYCRYVDDGRVVSRDRAFLEDLIPRVREYLWRELRLKLHPTKTKIVRADHDLLWLGSCTRPFRSYATNPSVVAFRALVRRLEHTLTGQAPVSLDYYHTALSALNSYLGHFRHFDDYRMVQETLKGSPLWRVFAFAQGYRQAMFNENITKLLKSQNYV